MDSIKCNDNSNSDNNIQNTTCNYSFNLTSDRSNQMLNELASQLNRINVSVVDENKSHYMRDEQNSSMDIDENIDKQMKSEILYKGYDLAHGINHKNLIVTNVDPDIFVDDSIRKKFEELFKRYDKNITFTYLKTFNQVRLNRIHNNVAQAIRDNMDKYLFNRTQLRCYLLQEPNENDISQVSDTNKMDSSEFMEECSMNSEIYDRHKVDYAESSQRNYLAIPKLTKQYFISPPASPPAGWEPKHEGSPMIDIQLISALANLVPGKLHEIHQGNESQPGIFIEVCEGTESDYTAGNIQTRIPKTMSPESFRSSAGI